jgi:hypothetical protein
VAQNAAVIGLRSDRKAWAVGLVLAVVTVAIYWPVRQFDFVQYDDPEYVFENDTVRGGLSRWGIVWSIVDAHASNWHPVTWISHMLDCQLFGLRPGGHHLVNVLLHSANSALLFWVLRAMTGAFWRSAIVAALFAWHPLRVESVAWISERKDVLSGLFFLLTVWAYERYVAGVSSVECRGENPGARRGSRITHHASRIRDDASCTKFFYILSLFLFALGLMSKPMLVTVPVLLLLLDYWPLGRVTGDGWRVTRLLREKIPFFGLALCIGVITFLAQRASGAVIPLKSEGIGARLGMVLTGYLAYLEKLFWPHDLSVLYLRPASVPIGSVLVAAAILVAITVAVFAVRRRYPYLPVGWLWYVVMLLPVCGLVQTGLQAIADRYTYLPAIGICLIVVWGVGGKSEVRNPKSEKNPNDEARTAPTPPASFGFRISDFGFQICAIMVLVACLILTRKQLAYWRNTETLMGRALEIDPGNYIAHNDLAVYYDKHGQPEAARRHRDKVRELDPALRQNPN